MIFNRPWFALLFAGLLCALENAQAQDSLSDFGSAPPATGLGGTDSGGTGTGGTGTGAAGGPAYPGSSGAAGGTGAQGGNASGSPANTPGGTPATGTTSDGTTPPKPGAASSFGSSSDAGLGATGGGSSVTGSQASTQGVGFGTPKAPTSEVPSFTLPGFYGSSATTFTAGQGRLARPRFRYTTSLSMGYDDNIFQTPTKSKGTEAVTVPVEVEPAIPVHLEQRPAFRFIPPSIGDGGLYVPGKTVPNGFETFVVPATPAKIENVVVVPAQPAAKRTGSALTQASASADMQIFTARSLFTFDVNGSASEYWSRPGGKMDYNGSTVFSFLYRLTPRLQFTSQFNGAYLSQPDLSRINTPQDQSGSNYLTTNAKSDLTYRWNRRVTSVFSISDNALIYEDKAQEAGNYNETVFGTELRYLWSARVTYLSEVRFSKISYQGSETRDSDTFYALIGAEARLTNRFSGTLRLGASMRTFTLEGDLSSTPYMEGSIAYRSGPTTIWNLTTRFGFEEPFAAGQERQVLRSGLSYSKTFSPRLSGLASSNFVFESTSAAATKSSSSSYDANARLEYRLTKSVSLNTNVSYLKANSGSSATDYYRIRCFFGLEYTF